MNSQLRSPISGLDVITHTPAMRPFTIVSGEKCFVVDAHLDIP